jgi:hypothetical protein
MKYACALVALFCGLFWGCSEEKSERLPDLPPVEIPADVFGFYSGRLPCDDCKQRAIDMDLHQDGSVDVVQSILKDSVHVDSLRGTFTYADSIVKMLVSQDSLGMLYWVFKRDKVGNLAFMKSGNVYRDADGMKFVMVRFYKKIKK